MSDRGPEREYLHDNLRSGLKTEHRLDGEPQYLNVAWISWDSGFRGSGLRISDRILAVDGVEIRKPTEQREFQRWLPQVIGNYAEYQPWTALGYKEGQVVRLKIRRRRDPGDGWVESEVSGTLRFERTWSILESNRHIIGPGGPERLGRDGFDDAWMSWYDKRIFDWERILDGGWQGSLQTRSALASHLEHKPRVDALVERYPGPFATAMRDDWEAVRACLAGDPVQLPADALAFRTRGEEQVKRITALAQEGWKRILAAHAAETLPAFPAIDPFRGDRAAVAGKLIALPMVGQREWIVDMGRAYLAWNQSGHWIFAPIDSEGMGRAFSAMRRYQKLVAPSVKLDIEVLGRLLPDPRLLAGSGRTAAGLEIEPVAVRIGGVVCVEIPPGTATPRFAGEETVLDDGIGPPPDDASPRQVLEAMIAAVKRGDQEVWNGLFTDWHAVPDADRPIYYPVQPWGPTRDDAWLRSRRLLLDKVLDARVRWCDDPRVIIRGDEAPGLPRIEGVDLEIDHVGLFDGEARTFNSVEVHRRWKLQRRDGGPWRISSHQNL
jgi:hypothetical protein